MRLRHTLLLVGLLGCDTQDIAPTTGAARFPDYPTQLFSVLEQACTEPAQSFLRTGPDHVECREFLPPEATAAIILAHDGTPTDLPRLVIRFRGKNDGDAYLVRNEVFLDVPQRTGAPLRIEQHDPRFARRLDALYRRTGGVPE